MGQTALGRYGIRYGVLAAVILGLAAVAAQAALPVRIASVNDSARIQIAGNVSPRLAKATDLGAVAADKTLTSLALRFSMTAAQQAKLTALLGELQDPASPEYHQWLTPEQFGAEFGMSSSDLAQVQTWLASQGLTVTEVARGGQFVRFSGTAAQVEQAFQTPIDRVMVDGVEHFANTVAPSLPASIAAVTEAVTGLDDFHLHPQHVAQQIAPDAVQQIVSSSARASSVKPKFTSPHTGDHYLAPGDLYTMYDENTLLAKGVNGTGVSIAVVGQADINLTDIANFRTASGLAANVPTVDLYGTDPGSSNSGDVVESDLDVEWSGAIAPSSKILFVTATDVVSGSLTEAIDKNLAPILSMSYGDCEQDFGTSLLVYYDQLIEQGAAEGITMVGPAGDDGASDCDYQASTAKSGFAVDFPGSSPYFTSVGGTELNEGPGTYWSTSNGTNSGSALSYIPEVVWNDSSLGTLAAGGGGASVYFAKPSWQAGTGVPADAARDVPDVSMPASPNHDPYLICTSGYCASGYYSTAGYLSVVGGTSVGTPITAGYLALVEQQMGARLGVANNELYGLASSSYGGDVFHDIVTGNNDSPCQAGTTDCLTGVAFGFTAGPGYDQASGLGSIDVGNLVNYWPTVTAPVTTPTGATPTIVNLTGSASSVTVGTAITLTASVSSGVSGVTTTPTGTVQFTVDGTNVGTPVTLSGNTASYTLATASLATGAHKIQATYSGDGTYLGSRAAFGVTILSATAPDFTLTPASATLTATSGTSSSPLTLTVTPVNGFTGVVTFTVSAASPSVTAEPVFSSTTVTVSGTSPASTTFTLLAFLPLARSGGTKVAGAAGWMQIGGGVFFAGLLLLLAPKRRRLGMLLVFVAATGMFGIMGCSNNAANPPGEAQTNATAGTYTYTVFATGTVSGTAVTHSTVVTFVVQ